MTSRLLALGNRARSTTTLAAVLAAATLIAVPTPVYAANGRGPELLGEGAGMAGKPGARVLSAQRQLHRRGYDLGPSGVDGRFGPWTAAAVRRMQADHGLAVDGIIGDHTSVALGLRSPGAAHRHAQSDARREAEVMPVADVTPTRAVASLLPGPNLSPPRLELDTPETGSAVAAGVLGGGLGGAVAIMLFALQRNRRRQRESATAARELTVLPDLAPPPEERDPDAWTVSVPYHDEMGEPTPADAADRQRSPGGLARGCPVIGYLTVYADLGPRETARSSAAIQARCERSDWTLLEIVGDRENGRILERPGLGYALERIAEGHACALVVSDLQRLSRSIVDLGTLMAWFRDANATLIALDLGIDTSTAEGDRVATTLIALSARAHERIADRTRNRLAERRANGASNGRPAVRDRPELMERIATMRARGMTLQAITDQLNAENVPTLRGGAQWRPSSIQAALGYRRPGPRDHLPRVTRDRS